MDSLLTAPPRAARPQLPARDRLTGLPGRSALIGWLRLGGVGSTLGRRPDGMPGGRMAVLLLNLDQFSALAERYGPDAAETVVLHVVAGIRGTIPHGARIARVAGDEFAILLPDARPDQAASLAGRLIAVCAAPFGAGVTITAAVSVGIALGHAAAVDPDAMLHQATAALHQAKAQGGGTHRFFEPGLDQHTRQDAALQAELRGALQHSQFELNYQPQFDILTGRPCGIEALLRWHHPEMGVVAPGAFIAVAEHSGLIVPIGRWVTRAACMHAAQWGDLRLSVNLSPIQLRDPDLTHDIAAALAESRLPPDRLDLEITEGVFLHDTPSTISQLERLRALGVGITLDDFGTGYSSLSYLRLFPFTKLKIDRSFVTPATEDRAAACIIRAMIDLGRTLGMRVNAEGVETRGQLSLLQAAGCDEVQGFLLGRPMAPGNLMTYLAGEPHP